jgi:dihydroxyacid dehydratase/phosphogluconate dehydratase
MLRAVGFTDEDFTKPQVGIASSPSDLTPCNMHLGELAEHASNGVNAAGGKAVNFSTITVSDGISMGTQGMRYSLVSRDVIADSTAHPFLFMVVRSCLDSLSQIKKNAIRWILCLSLKRSENMQKEPLMTKA